MVLKEVNSPTTTGSTFIAFLSRLLILALFLLRGSWLNLISAKLTAGTGPSLFSVEVGGGSGDCSVDASSRVSAGSRSIMGGSRGGSEARGGNVAVASCSLRHAWMLSFSLALRASSHRRRPRNMPQYSSSMMGQGMKKEQTEEYRT